VDDLAKRHPTNGPGRGTTDPIVASALEGAPERPITEEMLPFEDFERTLAAARAGHGSALGELFHDLHPRIFRYLRALEPGEAEDLASDTWLDVAGVLPRFEGDERGLRALAFTIARRRLIDLQRRRARHPTFPIDTEQIVEEGWVGDVEEEAMAALSTEAALARVATLPVDQAEVVLLRVLGGLPVADVARILSKRPGTVRVLQHRALRRLAEQTIREGVTG
jgi:RNA polymerase sigma-70 factor (ECF subfamily)